MLGSSSTDRRNENSKRWYAANRDARNESRRKKYAEDSLYRKKAMANARNYRARRRDGETVRRVLTREYNGRTVRVHTLGYVADAIGRTSQMLRNWESLGLIPRSIFDDRHRLYTSKQVNLVTMLFSTVESNHRNMGSKAVKDVVKYVKAHWEDG